MDLIIGGTAQGKLDYAMEKYGLLPGDVWEPETCDESGIASARCIDNLQDYIGIMILERKEFDDEHMLECLLSRLRPDAVVICCEVGLGVVPREVSERVYREAVGRICRGLAERADSVERVYCGIPQRIK